LWPLWRAYSSIMWVRDVTERDDLVPEVHRIVEGFGGVRGSAGARARLAPEPERLVHVGVVHMEFGEFAVGPGPEGFAVLAVQHQLEPAPLDLGRMPYQAQEGKA